MRITDSIDLLYPNPEAKARAGIRRKEVAGSGTAFIEDLKLESVKRMISLSGSERFMALAGELSDDIPTVEYRLDCLEDFLNVPELSEVLRRTVSELSHSRPGYGGEEPEKTDSFYSIGENMDSLAHVLKTVESINALYKRIKGGVRSAAVKGLFGFFEGLSENGEFKNISKNLAELDDIFSKTIRSVRIGVNFTPEMVPDSAGIIEVSHEKIYPKGNVIERMVYGAGKERFLGEEHLNSATRRAPADIDTALFRELSEYTDEYARKIADALKSCRSGIFPDLSALENQLDYYANAADFIRSARMRGMPMCRPKILQKERRKMKISGLFDPVFYRQLVSEDALANLSDKIVLNDIELSDSAGFYMVTGANNGGKTTFARAAGLCQVFAQAGLYVPAESAEISVCDFIFTHFPHEEKAGIDSSRFTVEIKELKEIISRATPYSFVILNESLQSTTPEECLKIAAIHLELFGAAGVRGLYVTHLTGLYEKLEALNKKNYPTKFGSLVSAVGEGGEKRLYKIIPQKPSGESLAFSIYRRFGATMADVRAVGE